MVKTRLTATLLLILGLVLGYFVYATSVSKPFQLGLDLSGGSYLVYEADISQFEGNQNEIEDAMDALRDVLERRVNLFGVSEPSVQTETTTLAGEGKDYRVVVELPGVTDLAEATEMLGQTPLLEFKLQNPDFDPQAAGLELEEDGSVFLEGSDFDQAFIDTGLTGRLLRSARVQFSQGISGGHSGFGGEPLVAVEFNREGADLFAALTRDNVGEPLVIFLDGAPISSPVIQQEITGGEAVITGNFTPDEAKQLVGRLNSGALPVPINLASTQTIGPSLGADAINAGIMAGLTGFLFIAVFLIAWYRIPGIIATLALALYGLAMLVLFKTIPVTLTAAGLAGFIISLGIAVDANILIFERLKEELRSGHSLYDSIAIGFKRAWASIRDANISSLISAAILFWFGTSLIQGFALTFGLGVLVSMITAITVTRVWLLATAGRQSGKLKRVLFGTGLKK